MTIVDFTTDDWEFHLDDTPKDLKLATDEKVLPYISSPEAWDQYSNKVIYEVDKLIRGSL